MAGDLKNTGKDNLFVIFGEPDIDILPSTDGQVQVKINGVDVLPPEHRRSAKRRRLGANDPYKALKTTLKAEIDEAAWATLHSEPPVPSTNRAPGASPSR